MSKNLNFAELEKQLGYEFRDRRWLAQALRHSSYTYESPQGGASNERLEFLGDAVLDLAISDLLVSCIPEAAEGVLSRCRASLVNARHLAGIARRLGLGAYLLLGRGEEQQSGRQKPSVLADALEAVVAAIYMDGGYESAREVIKDLFQGSLEFPGGEAIFQDHKTALQEYAQKYLKVSPEYQLVQETGPAHDKIFEVEVRIAGSTLGRGQGKSKKQAAQEAARGALQILQQRGDHHKSTSSGQEAPKSTG